MKNHNFSLRAFALAVATLFATTGCGEDNLLNEILGGGEVDPDPTPTTATIKIAVSDIQGTSATVATTPKDATLTYLVDVAAKEEFETYATKEAFAAAIVESIKAEAEADGSALDAYLVAEGLLYTGGQRNDFAGLETSTDYVAYAFGLSYEGEITTGISTAEFTTLEGDPEPDKVTFTITATEITATSATVTVAPSDNTVDYYWNMLPTETVESKTEAELVAALEQMFENFYGSSLFEECVTGEDTYTFEDLDPSTEYTIFAFTYTEDGEAGEMTTQKITTEDSPIEILMTAGVYDKTSDSFVNTESALTMAFFLTDENNPITSVKFALFTTEEMNGYLKTYTYEALIEAAGDDFLADWITSFNTKGSLALSLSQNVIPDTEYSLLVQATAQDGKTAVLHTEAKTSAVEEASEAYNAWLGDWTVTSAGSLVFTNEGITETNDPISFDITIAAKSNDATYTVTGWGVTEDRLSLPCTGTFNISDGSFSLVNGSNIQQYSDGIEQILSVSKTSSGNYSMVGGSYDCFSATQAEDGTVTATGYVGKLTTGDTFEVIVCDYWFISSEDGKLYDLYFADEYEEGKYPMLPYTLTKKATTTTASKSAARATSSLRKPISVPTFSQFSTISRELKMARPAAMELQAAEAPCNAKALKNAASGKQSTDKKKLALELLTK